MLRKFTEKQCNAFLVMGETVTTNGVEFNAILDNTPFSIDIPNVMVEDVNYKLTTSIFEIKNKGIELDIGTEIVVDGIEYIIFNVHDDRSNMVEYSYRNKNAQVHAGLQ